MNQFTDPLAAQEAIAQAAFNRAQKQQQEMNMPQGTMAGQVYVPSSPLQYLGEMLRQKGAMKQEKQAMQQLQGIGQQRQEAQGRDMSAFVDILRGKAAQPAFEAAGPAPQGMPQEGGYTVPAQAARAGDPYAAYSMAASSQSPMVRQMGMQGMAQLPQMEQARAEKEAARAFQAEQKGLDRQAREDQIRMQLQGQQEMRQLMAANKPERQAQIIQTENGPMQLVGGKAVPIIGPDNMPVKAGGAEKPLNEGQANATMYGMRMLEADKILRDLEKKGVTDAGLVRSGLGGALGSVPLIGDALQGGVNNISNVLPSALGGMSTEQQQTKQARSNFITALLRKESGSAIGKDEFATAEAQYFPQAGDTAETIAQKQQARELAIQAMKIGAGPGASKIGGGGGGNKNAPTSSGW